jgi:hypothetical protein
MTEAALCGAPEWNRTRNGMQAVVQSSDGRPTQGGQFAERVLWVNRDTDAGLLAAADDIDPRFHAIAEDGWQEAPDCFLPALRIEMTGESRTSCHHQYHLRNQGDGRTPFSEYWRGGRVEDGEEDEHGDEEV